MAFRRDGRVSFESGRFKHQGTKTPSSEIMNYEKLKSSCLGVLVVKNPALRFVSHRSGGKIPGGRPDLPGADSPGENWSWASLKYSPKRRVLAIGFAAVADEHDADGFGAVVNFENHAVIADSDSPIAAGADNFAASRRSGILREVVQGAKQSGGNFLRKSAKIAFRPTFKGDLIHAAGVPGGNPRAF